MTQFAMGGGMQEYTIHSIRRAFFDQSIGKIHPALEYSDADLDWSDKENLSKHRPMYPIDGWIWHNCSNEPIKGRLWGGCLEVLDMHLSVRRYLPAFERLNDTILFIETSEEMPTEGFVYRFIASLGELDLLDKFKAILVAYPKAQFCNKQPPDGREIFIANQREAIKNALKDYHASMPVIFNMNFGHTDPQIIIPNGGLISIDSIKKTIEFI